MNMTIEEKLKHFYDISISETQRQASESIETHRQYLMNLLEEHKHTHILQAEAEIKSETEHAKREINKALSAEQLHIKRQWSQRQNQLKDQLFAQVKKRLEEFIHSPQYEEYLYERIQNARKFAGTDSLQIYLSQKDSALLGPLSLKTGIPLLLSSEDFIGGIKAAIPEKNILIDESFLEAFSSLKKEFTFDGGLNHEHNS